MALYFQSFKTLQSNEQKENKKNNNQTTVAEEHLQQDV